MNTEERDPSISFYPRHHHHQPVTADCYANCYASSFPAKGKCTKVPSFTSLSISILNPSRVGLQTTNRSKRTVNSPLSFMPSLFSLLNFHIKPTQVNGEMMRQACNVVSREGNPVTNPIQKYDAKPQQLVAYEICIYSAISSNHSLP